MQMQRVHLTEPEHSDEEGSPFDAGSHDQYELMTANLLKIKREITEREEEQHHQHQFYSHQHGEQGQDHDGNAAIRSHMFTNSQQDTTTAYQYTKQMAQQIEQQHGEYTVDGAHYSHQLLEEIRGKYKEFLMSNSLPLNHQQKLSQLLDQQLTIASTVALFQMLFYFREAISEEILTEITERALEKLMDVVSGEAGLDKQERQMEEHCLMELLAISGVYNERLINFVIQNLLENKIAFMPCFLLLNNMGFGGLAALVHLARQDFKQIPMLILDNLSRSEEVICELIIPTLMDDLLSFRNKGREREIIFAILNRLGGLVSQTPDKLQQNTKYFQLLIDLMQNSNADRGFISSVLRSAGAEGQKILLEFMTQAPNNQRIMLPIVSVLPWRVKPDPVLRIKAIQYTLGSNFLPGTLYQYQGNIEPSAFCFQDQPCYDSLCLNARDFIAALQRLLSTKMENYENEQSYRTGPANSIKNFLLYEVIGKKQEQEEIQISSDVITALTKSLSNSKPEIRQASLNSLGLIGLPESFESIDEISKCLWDKDSRNRSMACWALSKLCEQPSRKIIQRLTELLKDNFWKVRISACICIGAIVNQPYQNVIQALVKCLKDNSVNKVTVCQTILKLGGLGEQILLEILRNTPSNDFKLKEAVIYSLKDADVKVSSIDFVLEEIFKHCKGARIQTRAACLETLNSLRMRANEEGEEIVYLKAKSILPFYYYFLEDPASKIREMAAEAIFSFGGQAELIFIEGMTKGNSIVRIQSAKGLGKLGVQNFRALILGLRDDDVNVRKITSEVIIQNFTSDDVAICYSNKRQQVASLLCNLKDILMSGGLSPKIRTFIKETIYNLEKYGENMDMNDLHISGGPLKV